MNRYNIAAGDTELVVTGSDSTAAWRGPKPPRGARFGGVAAPSGVGGDASIRPALRLGWRR